MSPADSPIMTTPENPSRVATLSMPPRSVAIVRGCARMARPKASALTTGGDPRVEGPAQVFHSSPIDAEVAVSDPGRRAKVDGVLGGIDDELDVIDEPEQPAPKLGVHIVRVARHDARPRVL